MANNRNELRHLSWMLPLMLVLIAAIVILFIVWLLLPDASPDTEAPRFFGVKDLSVKVGEGISYRSGVRAEDLVDGVVDFSVDASGVMLSTPGVYTVVYTSTDAAGNVARAKATVTVVAASAVSEEELGELVDRRIADWGLRGLSREMLYETIYWKIKGSMTYVSDSDKSDWMGEAARGFLQGEGDCFTYYAMVRAILWRMEIDFYTVQRSPGARDSTHYWMMVETEADVWYHFDVCPHPKEFPLSGILLTDAELAEYNTRVEGYYTYDREGYPETP